MTLPQAILSLEESYNRIAARMGGTQFKYERVAVGGIARLEALAEAFATLTGASTPPATRSASTASRLAPPVKAASEPAELSRLRAELAAATCPKMKYKLAMKIRYFED